MRLEARGKNIAILFYARTRVIILRTCRCLLFVGLVHSTGLVCPAKAAARRPPAPEARQVLVPLDFTTLESLRFLRIARTNVASKAYEEITIDQKGASLRRNTRFAKSLLLEPEVLKTLENRIRALGKYESGPIADSNGIRVEISLGTEDGEETFAFDPVGPLQTVFADVMDIRNRVLTDGQ